MKLTGQFSPWVVSYVIDRMDVTRMVMAQKWFGMPLPPIPDPGVKIWLVRTEITPEEGGAYGQVQWYFEGIEGEAGKAVYEFQGSFNQEPIASHPQIFALLTKYGGQLLDGEIDWPIPVPAGTTGKSGVLANSNNGKGLTGVSSQAVQGDVNLMYGVQSYLAIGAVWTQTIVYALDSFADANWITSGIGWVIEKDKVPGKPPTPEGRNWLEMSPTATQRGNCMQVTRSFMLSGKGGWIKDIYNGQNNDGKYMGSDGGKYVAAPLTMIIRAL